MGNGRKKLMTEQTSEPEKEWIIKQTHEINEWTNE